MLKKTITYTDFKGKERTEDFMFHITKTELTKLNVSYRGGVGRYIQDAIDSDDANTLLKFFDEIIKLAYGVRSDDGRAFLKSEAAYLSFYHSEAYDKLFMELMGSEELAGNFINALFPEDVVKAMAETLSKNA